MNAETKPNLPVLVSGGEVAAIVPKTLVTPPVGLNLFVINGIAPDIPLKAIMKGVLPFIWLMLLAVLLLCLMPGIAMWLPDHYQGS